MKNSNALISISLAVLGGFFIGIVSLNLYTPNIVALGASAPSDPPNSALKSVTHNATLTGDGTTTAPLGIANGGVTAPKIAAASPAPGQLLSFNGTGLAWQAPAVGGVRVVDSLGHDVGPVIGSGSALRRMGAFTFLLSVDQSGFRSLSIPNGGFTFYHTTLDCSGTRYFPASRGTPLIRFLNNNSTQVFFASDPIQELQIRSYEDVQDPGQPGTCAGAVPGTVLPVGVATSMSLLALGLTPPFRLEF